LDEQGNGEEFIETVPKRGYRFVAPVKLVECVDEIVLQRRVQTHIVAAEEVDEAELVAVSSPQPSFGQPQLSLPESSRTLRWKYLLLAGLLPVVVVAGLWLLWQRRARSGVEPIKNIAVLPFKFVGAAHEEEYLGLGLTDALITKLSKLRQITVRPTGVVLKYQGQDIIAAGRALRVDAVLDGRVQKFGESVQVRLQLVRVSDEAVLLPIEVMGRYADLLALQDSISAQLTRALALHLTGEEQQRFAQRYTENAEAYHAYLQGRYFWNRRGDDWANKAIAAFEQAVKLDPHYALAYAGLADTYIILGDHSRWPPKEAFPKAKAAAVRALELDESLAEAHTPLAHVKFIFDWDWPGAEREYRRAIELNPAYALGYGWYGVFLAHLRRFAEAQAMIQQGQALDPLLSSLYSYASSAQRRAGQFDQAVAQARKALELDPDFATAIYHLGLAYEQKGNYAEAITALSRALSLGPSYKSNLAHVYSRAGKREEALKLLDELKALSAERYIRPFSFAIVYVGLGEHAQALEWLDKAVEERDPWVTGLATEPRFNPLRSNPKFTELLRRVGLPVETHSAQ
jgi:tetratricopeptide (TPR) repeat protein/TolB-like protein